MLGLNQPSLDLIALCYFLATLFGFQLISALPPLVRRSIVGAVQMQRIAWMRNMGRRENRMLDGVLLNGLSQGNAFFASTSAIAIGGLTAMLGSGEKVQVLLDRLPLAGHGQFVSFEVKVLLMIAIFVYAFFKFAWAFRLSHYVAIMIGAMPVPTAENVAECDHHATRSAGLIGLAAEHANGGLRSFYYAIAAMGWFFHPLLFITATTWVLLILVRRDFFSRSLHVLADRLP